MSYDKTSWALASRAQKPMDRNRAGRVRVVQRVTAPYFQAAGDRELRALMDGSIRSLARALLATWPPR